MYIHFQDYGVAAGSFIRVYQAAYVRVLESLKQNKLLSHPVSPHQFLVYVFNCHCAFGAAVVAAFDNRETTPDEK